MEMLLPLLVLIGLAGGPLVWLVVSYNRFVGIAQHRRESWSDIEVEMKRRYDLIPRLVETARGYAAHEREVLEQVVALRHRAEASRGSATEQAIDETALGLGMKRLFALVESYPALKADVHFLALQEELAHTEDRLAAARRFYNGNVRELNQLCEQFPTNVVAGVFGFTRGSYFELASDAERVVPRVG